MFLLNARCSFRCLLIIASTGLLHIVNAESFRPIFNPNIGSKPIAVIRSLGTSITTSTTVRPLTTISATLKSRVSLTKQQVPPQQAHRSPVKPLSSSALIRSHQSLQPPKPTSTLIDTTIAEKKDAPVAEALRGDPYYMRGYYRRPYYYPSNNLYYNLRSRRRPKPKPYYSASSNYAQSSPYEDYRFETDFLDQSGYASKPKKKTPILDSTKDYMGIIDTDIGQFYDSQSATYNVPPLKNYEQSGYYSSGGSGSKSGSNTPTGIGSNYGSGGNVGNFETGNVGGDFGDYGDINDFKYSTSKPKTNYKISSSRTPIKQIKTRTKYASYDENDFRYGIDSGSDIEDVPATPSSLDKYNNIYLPQQTVYQTAPKQKPKPKPKPKPTKTTTTTTTTTTYRPPIKYSDTSIDVLTKPLGSATFNLNLSPGHIYNPPSINYNPIEPSYKSIPIQPPSTSYGIPIAPPLNNYQYQNTYSNQFGGYPPSSNNFNPSQISITNPIPGQYAEPPPLNQVQLSNVDINYNSLQSSYDATPKQSQSPTRKPIKINSKRVSTKPPPLNTDEEIIDDEHEQNDYSGESYSYFKTAPQPPSLPNNYDQDEFHTIKNKRKQSKQTPNEHTRFTKKSKQPIEVTLRIPDEDYLDDLVKVVQTTKRPKKKNKQTTSHVLDTEDLRDAYDHNAAYYPNKGKKQKSHTRYQNMQNGDYDNYENDDDTNDDDYENDRVSHVNSKENPKIKTQKDQNDDLVEPRFWDKTSNIYKQYGIRARNDHFPVGSSHEVYRGNDGFRPIQKNENEQDDIFAIGSSIIRPTYVRAPISDQKYSNDKRIPTTITKTTTSTLPSTTLYVWDGKELPKNHKMI